MKHPSHDTSRGRNQSTKPVVANRNRLHLSHGIKNLGRYLLLMGVLCLTGGLAKADVLVSWEMGGLPGGNGNYGASPFASATANANLTIVGLTRGPGIATTGTAAGSAWGGANFTTADEAGAIAGNDFVTFSITPNAGKTVSFSGIPAYNIRRSGTGPTTGIWQYQVGAGSFTDIGSAITWGSTTSGTGNSKPAIDLSGIAALQNIPAGTTVTFRVVTWGGTMAQGTWYFNNIASGADVQVEGTVSQAAPLPPVVSAASSILSSGFTANWNASTGATGYRLDVSLANDFSSFVGSYSDLDAGNVLTTAVSGLSAGTTYYYRLRAYNGSGTSVNSITNSVITSSAGTPSLTITLPGQGAANTGTPNAQTAGVSFAATIKATTDGTTTDVTYTGNKNLTFSGPTGNPTYPATVNFASGVGTANITLTKAEATTLSATDGTIIGAPSSSVTVNPGAIAAYTVTAPPTPTIGLAFLVTVVAKDALNNVVTTDSSTSVTLSSASGNVLFDVNPQTLAGGTFTVNATGNVIETTTITATDGNSKTGTSANVVVSAVPQYRSKQDGNWNDISTWEVSVDGGTVWADAIATPTALDSTNTIRNTVTITASVTVDQVVVVSGGTLVLSSAFNVSDGAGDDIDVQSGGVFVLGLTATIPTFASGADAKIETGGTLRVNGSGLTGNGAGVNSSSFVYGNASVLEYNFSGAFSASGVTFFPNVDADTVPIFRNAKSNVSVGGGSATVFKGIFEVASGLTATWTGTGVKTFRNGIRGDGNVTQGSGSGQFLINGASAELGGGTLTLNTGGMQIDAASTTTMSSDKTVNTAAGTFTVNGVLDLNGKTLNGSATVASGGTLKGTGTVAGIVTVNNGATVAPGLPLGTLSFSSAPVLAGTSMLAIDRNGTPNADQISVAGALTYGGTLVVSNAGAALQSGDTFTLFAAGGFGGLLDTVTLPDLAPGLSWNTSALLTAGTVSVIGAGGGNDGGTLGLQSSGGGAMQIGINGTAGATYQLQYSDSLAPLNWQNLGDAFVMPAGNTTNITDSTSGTSRFYRTVKTGP